MAVMFKYQVSPVLKHLDFGEELTKWALWATENGHLVLKLKPLEGLSIVLAGHPNEIVVVDMSLKDMADLKADAMPEEKKQKLTTEIGAVLSKFKQKMEAQAEPAGASQFEVAPSMLPPAPPTFPFLYQLKKKTLLGETYGGEEAPYQGGLHPGIGEIVVGPGTSLAGFDAVPGDKIGALEAVPLVTATKLYQPVKGTSPGSRYYLIGFHPGLRLAARYSSTGMSFRAEGTSLSSFASSLKNAGFSVNPPYASMHLGGINDILLARKVCGSVLLGLGIPFSSPIPDVSVILNK